MSKEDNLAIKCRAPNILMPHPWVGSRNPEMGAARHGFIYIEEPVGYTGNGYRFSMDMIASSTMEMNIDFASKVRETYDRIKELLTSDLISKVNGTVGESKELGYGTPNVYSLGMSFLMASKFLESGIYIESVHPSVEGGVGMQFSSGGTEYSMDICNDGDVCLTARDRTGKMAFDMGIDDMKNLAECIKNNTVLHPGTPKFGYKSSCKMPD